MFTRPKNRRQQVLEFVHRYLERHGYAPSVREICHAVGLRSTRAAKYHLDILVREGRLERAAGRARSLSAPSRPAALPLVGRIAAGSPLLAVENVEDHVSLGRYEGCFLLRVQGDSMRDAGIVDGDLVIVNGDDEPRAGDIVVARVGEEATVKYFRPGEGKVTLEPANPGYRPIVVAPDESGESPSFAVAGVVVGLLRNYR